jgi:hypothetical protein
VPVVAVDSMIIDLLDENLRVEADIAEAIEALEPPPISLSSPAYAVYWLARWPRSGEVAFIRSRRSSIKNWPKCPQVSGGTQSGYFQ